MSDWIEIAKAFGLPVVLLAYFVWRDFTRSKKDERNTDELKDRIQSAEDFQKNELQDLAIKNQSVVEQNTMAMTQHTTTMAGLTKSLMKRPCMKEDE